jgi:D-alanyl-D-alanine carboxypeptidase/D-alanyl-D-alanine-endopeptidase (penicillin-binding protein 4)
MKKQFCVLKKLLIVNYALLIFFSSCSVSKQLAKSADKILLKDSSISTGHIGISIYEPATNSYWYNYDAAKYFVPASNVKLFTCYAGMKYLGDSLIGLKYYDADSTIYIEPTADPTFLHDDFKTQSVLDFLKNQKRNIYITTDNWKDKALGKGWAWDDYNDSYMAERSPFPVFGNIAKFIINRHLPGRGFHISVHPSYFEKKEIGIAFMLNNAIPSLDITYDPEDTISSIIITRNRKYNEFEFYQSKSFLSEQKIPFCTDTINTALEILKDDYNVHLLPTNRIPIPSIANGIGLSREELFNHSIKTQPTDSLLKPMMHRSDNFFAEQTLLMVSNEHLGYMNDGDIIDTLLKTDFKDVPQKPKWVDGCGLSRYNLFTPQSFVYILNKMKNDFGLERLKVILPTSSEGTLKNYYLKDSSFIYAKTGSLSNNVSLSGFLITKKNKLLIFSILVNNFQNDSSPVRAAIEHFIENIRGKY